MSVSDDYFWQTATGHGGNSASGTWVLNPDSVTPATLDIDFVGGRAWNNGALTSPQSLLTCTRASTGYYQNAAGTLQSFGSNVLRTGTNGLLVEEARTNLLLRNTLAGGVGGSPGTGPTGWSNPGSGIVSYAQSTLDTTGTFTAISVIASTERPNFTSSNLITVAISSVYCFSIYIEAASGTFNVNQILGMNNQPANSTILYFKDGVQLASGNTAVAGPGRYWMQLTTTDTGGANLAFKIGLGVSGNATGSLTCSMPQVELGSFPTSIIPTTTVSVTRALDVVKETGLAYYTQGTGTAYWNGLILDNSSLRGLFSFDDNTSSNRIDLRSSTASGFISNAGVTQAAFNVGTATTNVSAKYASAWTTNDMAAVRDNGTASTDASGTPPANVTQLLLGLLDNGTTPLNGYIKRFAYWNSRISNANLQVLTT